MSDYIKLLNNKKFKEALEAAEKEAYMEAFKYCRFNQVKTAKLLEVSRGTFRTKLKSFGWWDY